MVCSTGVVWGDGCVGYVELNWYPVNLGGERVVRRAYRVGIKLTQVLVLTDYGVFSRGCLGRWLL